LDCNDHHEWWGWRKRVTYRQYYNGMRSIVMRANNQA
jgi:hypothetical protein